MNKDAALDELAFMVGLRLMGPDDRRRLRISLARDPGLDGAARFNVGPIEALDELVSGRRGPVTFQDRLDLSRAEAARTAPPFDNLFWIIRVTDLVRSGFTLAEASKLIEEVKGRVEIATLPEETSPCSA
jgi:hypothetical protein